MSEGTFSCLCAQTAMFMFHEQATRFPTLTREGEGQNPSLPSTLLGDPILPLSLSSCTSQSQTACWWEWKTHNLSSNRSKESDSTKKNDRWKQKKNSIFQSCWACCYGDEPPLHLFPLTYCLYLLPSPCDSDIFFFFIFFLGLPTYWGSVPDALCVSEPTSHPGTWRCLDSSWGELNQVWGRETWCLLMA